MAAVGALAVDPGALAVDPEALPMVTAGGGQENL